MSAASPDPVGGAPAAHDGPRTIAGFDALRALAGQTLGTSDWLLVDQARIDAFAQVTEDEQWNQVIGVNLSGVWNTGRVSIEPMIANGQGGAVILTSSTGGLIAPGANQGGMLGYTAAKHGVIGLMRAWANYCAPHYIRVNSVCPTTVRTPMAGGGNVSQIIQHSPNLALSLTNAIPVEAVDAEDIANAVAFLASDAARYITGTALPVDAGNINRK